MVALRPGIEAGGPERIGTGAGRLHEHFLSRTRREKELLLRHQTDEAVTVACDLVEAVTVERELVIQVRSDIPNAPQLRLAGAERNRGIEHAVHRAYGVVADLAMHDLPAPDLRILQQQYVLSQIAQLRKRIEQPLDDQCAGHAVSHLLIGAAVGMRMVPVQSRWVG